MKPHQNYRGGGRGGKFRCCDSIYAIYIVIDGV